MAFGGANPAGGGAGPKASTIRTAARARCAPSLPSHAAARGNFPAHGVAAWAVAEISGRRGAKQHTPHGTE